MKKSSLWWFLSASALTSVLTLGCMWDAVEDEIAEVTVEAAQLPTSVFGSKEWNTAIGLGGGASGGKWGSRRGGLGRLALNPRTDTSGESYSKVKENAFKLVSANPLSTFGVDVDTASYTNVRRYLNYGQLPPAAAVRVEEMINYFRFDYPKPPDRDSFSVSLEQGACPWNTDHQLVLVGLQGRDIPPDQIPPRNLVFLIDVSGSMSAANKLPLVTRSLKLMLRKLTDKDTVAVVTYAGQDRVALEPTSCADISTIENCLDNLTSSGGTNGAGGIQKSYQLAQAHFAKEHINRVILVTDGDFNIGETKQDDLKKLIEKQRDSGVYLTVIGVGSGNLGDARMSMLAKHGNGQYLYVDGDKEARRQLDERLAGTLVTIAKDVKLQVEFNPGKVAAYRLIGYERRVMKAEEFRDDKKDSGEVGAGHSVTALYEVVPAGRPVPGAEVTAAEAQVSKGTAKQGHIMDVRLRYKAPWGERAKESSYRLEGQAAAKASGNLEFAGAVATFGMVLAKSAHLGNGSLAMALELAQPLSGKIGARVEFLQLVTKALELTEAAARKVAAETVKDKEARAGLHALEFLATQQQPDGSYSAIGDCPVSDVGLTSLVILAFLSEGSSTLRRGEYKNVIKGAVSWLRRQQTQQGQFSRANIRNAPLEQVLASLAVCEAHWRSSYKLLKRNAERGREYLVNHLRPGAELRGWYLLANKSFKAAKLAGIDDELKAHTWETPGHPELKAPVGVYDALAWPASASNPRAVRITEIAGLLPTASKVLGDSGPNAAVCYFTTLAAQAAGGEQAKAWGASLQARLNGLQSNQGSFTNSVRTADPIYDTALMVMSLTALPQDQPGR
ncbi:MAG: von Willebrand factor type A domain-containing protein [Planctomycetota bacterium]|nr:von Willebrand factor type A domain-containing protein [Planctomycetota bacterium]